MQVLVDYYRVLQVHSLAEPEVIESAYKRLAKKYHPDVNRAKDSEHRMKQINEAYEILKDAGNRRRYDAQLAERQNNKADKKGTLQTEIEQASVVLAQPTLAAYFLYIKNKRFETAYELIAGADKNRISADEFIRWQSAVSKIYRLEDYDCSASKTNTNLRLCGILYQKAVEFAVVTVEHNTVMNRPEKDIVNKIVVLEKDGWRIYLGYEDIKPYIAKFEELNEMLTAKEVIHEMVELYSNKDHLSGLYSKKGFIEEAEKEMWRFGRYGNAFSLMLIELNDKKSSAQSKGHELQNQLAQWAGKRLKDNFRKLDILGRWGDTTFIALMPETNLDSGLKAALKIKAVFETDKIACGDKAHKVTINIGIAEFKDTLEHTIGKLNQYISAANQQRGNHIVYCSGVL